MAHFTAASRNVLKGLGRVVQGVINATLLSQLLQLMSTARTVSLESTQAHVLREKDISMQSFLVQLNRSPIPCFPTHGFQSPWVLQQKYGIWLAWCSRS